MLTLTLFAVSVLALLLNTPARLCCAIPPDGEKPSRPSVVFLKPETDDTDQSPFRPVLEKRGSWFRWFITEDGAIYARQVYSSRSRLTGSFTRTLIVKSDAPIRLETGGLIEMQSLVLIKVGHISRKLLGQQLAPGNRMQPLRLDRNPRVHIFDAAPEYWYLYPDGQTDKRQVIGYRRGGDRGPFDMLLVGRKEDLATACKLYEWMEGLYRSTVRPNYTRNWKQLSKRLDGAETGVLLLYQGIVNAQTPEPLVTMVHWVRDQDTAEEDGPAPYIMIEER